MLRKFISVCLSIHTHIYIHVYTHTNIYRYVYEQVNIVCDLKILALVSVLLGSYFQSLDLDFLSSDAHLTCYSNKVKSKTTNWLWTKKGRLYILIMEKLLTSMRFILLEYEKSRPGRDIRRGKKDKLQKEDIFGENRKEFVVNQAHGLSYAAFPGVLAGTSIGSGVTRTWNVPIWASSAAGSSLTCYSTTLALTF